MFRDTIHISSLQGAVPLVVAVMAIPCTDCLPWFSCSGQWNVPLLCSILSSTREGTKNSKQMKHTQRILEGVKGFSHLRDAYGKNWRKSDFLVTIQELCSHNYFHFRMTGVKDHILYTPKPWRGAMSLSGIQKMQKNPNFSWIRRKEKDTKEECNPQSSRAFIRSQKIK